MSHQEVQEIAFEIPKSQRSPTANSAPKVVFSDVSPSQHKHLKSPVGEKNGKDEMADTIPEGIPMNLFSFADCVLSHSVSEGPGGRREILLQENEESPVKTQHTRPIKVMEGNQTPTTPRTPKMFQLQLQKLSSAPEVQEVNEKQKSPNHAALTNLLNLILKEQEDYETTQGKPRGETPEKEKSGRKLSINLVNKFAGLQKNNSHNSSQTSLHERSNSNLLLSGDRTAEKTTEKSSRNHTEPTSKVHSRVGSFGKINILTQPDIIWETTEVESGTIYRRRISRLSADYSHLSKQYKDYPIKPVELDQVVKAEVITPTLSPRPLNTEESTPVKKNNYKNSPTKKSPTKQASRNFGSRIKNIKAKLFPVKPQSLQVKTTVARWPSGSFTKI